MTPLRQRMLDALELRAMAVRTREAYIDAVAKLAQHYKRSPDQLSADEVHQYLLYLLRERKLARASINQYGCAFRFLYGVVLGLDGQAFQIPLGPAPQHLPEILSRAELVRLFAAARHAKSRTYLMVAYGTGLWLSELCRLRVQDIDSAADRRCIHVHEGKGAKDRYVPLGVGDAFEVVIVCSSCLVVRPFGGPTPGHLLRRLLTSAPSRAALPQVALWRRWWLLPIHRSQRAARRGAWFLMSRSRTVRVLPPSARTARGADLPR